MKSIFFGVSGVVLAAGLGLTSCGSTPATATATTIRVGATNFVTLPPTQSTNTPVTSGEALPGTKIELESTYVIQAGDYPSTVAQKFKVAFADLMALNQWTLADNGIVPEWPGVGGTIKIPAGATVPDSSGAATPSNGTTAPAAESTAAPVTTEKICTSDTPYTITNGDAPANVAARFKTTVNKLNQANGGTKGYANFVVGTVIKIPIDC